MVAKVDDKTSLNISLSYLIQIAVAISVAVYGYATLTEQIRVLETKVMQLQDDAKEHSTWIRDWETGGMLPLDVEQNEKIKFLQKELDDIRQREYQRLKECEMPVK
jgi:hypothetical protein